MNKIFPVLAFVFAFSSVTGQTGKYFTASNEKCKNFKVFIDHRIQQYCGTAFTINWDGECANGFASGKGKLQIICSTGELKVVMIYKGNLYAGKKNGSGWLVVFCPLSNVPVTDQETYTSMLTRYEYKGTFKNDEFDGFGEFKATYIYPYSGDGGDMPGQNKAYRFFMPLWRSDLFFNEYEGYFTNGRIADTENGNGVTRRTKPFGGRYNGAIKNGMPNGIGRIDESPFFPLPNGQASLAASGNFVNGALNGYGKETGRYFEFEGEFVNGIREGKGRMTFYEWSADKSGEYLNYSKKTASILEGNFRRGYADGFCTIFFQNKAAYKYTGPVKNGDLEGTGEIEFLDGSKFRGNFRNGKREGDGAVTFVNGDRFSGIYADDKPVRGTLYYINGSKYEGGMSIREDKNNITGKPVQVYIRQGRGTMTDKDGKTYSVNCDNNNCTENY